MNILVTGASSGIGEALARECAKRGDRLFLCGRDEERLGKVAEACRRLGAGAVDARTVDVAVRAEVDAWMREADASCPLDIVFANAGVSTGEETEDNARRTFEVNCAGGVNTVMRAIELMRKRSAGHIVITASIAGYGPLKACPSYSASKSMLKTWGLSLRGMLAPEGIKVSVVCPGFVRSRITARNTCPMPFFMEADKAAKTILARVGRNIGLVAFPWPMRLAAYLASIMPWRANEFVNRLLPAKVV